MLESLQKYFNQLSSAQQIKLKNLKIFNRYILWFRSSFPESTLVWLQDAGMRTIVIRLDEQSLAVAYHGGKKGLGTPPDPVASA